MAAAEADAEHRADGAEQLDEHVIAAQRLREDGAALAGETRQTPQAAVSSNGDDGGDNRVRTANCNKISTQVVMSRF